MNSLLTFLAIIPLAAAVLAFGFAAIAWTVLTLTRPRQGSPTPSLSQPAGGSSRRHETAENTGGAATQNTAPNN